MSPPILSCTTRLITALTVLVLVNRASAAPPDASTLAQKIDEVIEARLATAKVPPAPQAGDAEFLRRIWLDLAGTVPPYARSLAFLQNSDARKREALIDELLASESFANYLGLQWGYRVYPPDADVQNVEGRRDMALGFAEDFRAGLSWDEMIQKLLTASGRGKGQGLDNRGHRFYERFRTPDQQVDGVGRLFLGLSVQCAQCHNHPFDPAIKRDDYWGLAGFFFKFNAQNLQEDPKQQKPKELPTTARMVAVKWLGGEPLELAVEAPRRPLLAEWLASRRNPYFARAFVNRVWMQMFGRGLLPHPNDVKSGEVTHPELLQLLTDAFTDSDFDVRFLFRAIALSQAYQRLGQTRETSARAVDLYVSMPVRPLTALQLSEVLQDIGARRKPGIPDRVFQQAELMREIPYDPDALSTRVHFGLSGMLLMLNSDKLNITERDVERLIQPKDSPAANVERLFVTLLTRLPTPQEKERWVEHISQAGTPRAGYADVAWILTNSTEFLTNR